MSSHYLDYTISLSEPQSGELSHLLGRLWQRLHGVLAADDIRHLGISLPRIRPKHTGNILRLHSDSATLQQVRDNAGIQQLVGLAEIHVGTIQPTPNYCEYRSFTRNRSGEKLTPAALLRSETRWLKWLQQQGKPIGIDQLLERREYFQKKAAEQPATAVYLRLTSTSTHQHFSLLIQASAPTMQAQAGKFSHYGLAVVESNSEQLPATVPWFE
ncbi:MAG: type I-F CRISPR-associated endoribonuclease Cas6/Csy4 [Thiothrix sp.]|jgi:CRISPR-associated endoribonuclease Cas6/Csy4 subtype I-F|nr:MAG: type I-F CRISPR-associated endoribonuclease Cas6/Csy4 [Thiothrix sp.]